MKKLLLLAIIGLGLISCSNDDNNNNNSNVSEENDGKVSYMYLASTGIRELNLNGERYSTDLNDGIIMDFQSKVKPFDWLYLKFEYEGGVKIYLYDDIKCTRLLHIEDYHNPYLENGEYTYEIPFFIDK